MVISALSPKIDGVSAVDKVSFIQWMRKTAAGLAVLAVLLTGLTSMAGMYVPGMAGELCGPSQGGGAGGDNPDSPHHHHCELCVVHCHGSWLPPIIPTTLIGSDRGVARELEFGLDFHFAGFAPADLLKARAPPVFI